MSRSLFFWKLFIGHPDSIKLYNPPHEKILEILKTGQKSLDTIFNQISGIKTKSYKGPNKAVLYTCLCSMKNKGLIKRIGRTFSLNKEYNIIPGQMSDKIYKQLENEELLYHMEDI